MKGNKNKIIGLIVSALSLFQYKQTHRYILECIYEDIEWFVRELERQLVIKREIWMTNYQHFNQKYELVYKKWLMHGLLWGCPRKNNTGLMQLEIKQMTIPIQ